MAGIHEISAYKQNADSWKAAKAGPDQAKTSFTAKTPNTASSDAAHASSSSASHNAGYHSVATPFL